MAAGFLTLTRVYVLCRGICRGEFNRIYRVHAVCECGECSSAPCERCGLDDNVRYRVVNYSTQMSVECAKLFNTQARPDSWCVCARERLSVENV